PLLEFSKTSCVMGVDTGKALHTVILQTDDYDELPPKVVHLVECRDFTDLDALFQRFRVDLCVIDGLPETHSTKEFSNRHRGKVYMNFFIESQRGEPEWDTANGIVRIHRTDALDASRAAIRERKVILPRREPIVEHFAAHLAADAKMLDENE